MTIHEVLCFVTATGPPGGSPAKLSFAVRGRSVNRPLRIWRKSAFGRHSPRSPPQYGSFSPVALGDHISERKQIDSYHWMTDALNYGCLYNWYPDHFLAEYETLTKYMFPSTPIELHEGYIIAKERIVTSRLRDSA